MANRIYPPFIRVSMDVLKRWQEDDLRETSIHIFDVAYGSEDVYRLAVAMASSSTPGVIEDLRYPGVPPLYVLIDPEKGMIEIGLESARPSPRERAVDRQYLRGLGEAWLRWAELSPGDAEFLRSIGINPVVP